MREMMTPAASDSLPPEWHPALAHSRYLRQLLDARPDVVVWLNDFANHALNGELMRGFLDAEAPSDEGSLKSVLRRLRQRIMAALSLIHI